MENDCNLMYCAFCAGAIRERIAAVRKLFRPVEKAKDIEAVHDLRVASRRLRAAISLFTPCLPRPAKRWRKAVREITRSLGRARDLDVQIAFVDSFWRKAGDPSWRLGVECLLKRLRRYRQRAQNDVIQTLARSRNSVALKEIGRALAKVAAVPWRGGRAAMGAFALAEQTVVPLLEDLLSYAPDLRRPDAVERHHRMRIAAKHLRYALEVFEPVYGPPVARAMRAARQMQGLLGGLHDCDVWLEWLPDFLVGQQKSIMVRSEGLEAARRIAPGIEALRRNRAAERRRLYREGLDFWGKTERAGTWSELWRAFRAAAEAPPMRRRRPQRSEQRLRRPA